MMSFFYQAGIRLFYFGAIASSFFNPKAKLFICGRKDTYSKLATQLSIAGSPIVWFHCASLGEFEQARPLIENFRAQGTTYRILITFFSPSGYEIRKNYDGADFIFYLPIDTKANAQKFLDIVKPSLVFFVKYDFWYNYLNLLSERKIPTHLVSANFRKEQFAGMYGRYLRKVLPFFSRIFVQNVSSQNILVEQKITHVIVSGDLRYDKVAQTALKPKKISTVEHFKGDSKILVAGSTWIQDEIIIASWKPLAGNWKLIIAPHEINEEHIQKIELLFNDSLRYSVVSKESVSTALDKLEYARVLILDNIGMLSNIYQYGSIAYVGGGFGSGIHNILEAVAFGLPVIFGPNHHKFPEAAEIIEQGGGFSISNADDFKKAIELLISDEIVLKMASMTCKSFIQGRRGATERILKQI